MKLRLPIVIGTLLLMLAGSVYFLTANGRGDPGTSKQIATCPRSDEFARYIEERSGAPSPAVRSTPLPEAGPFDKVYSDLLSVAETIAKEPKDLYSHDVQTKLQQFWWDTLWKKHITGWEGWVVSTGTDAVRSMDMGYDLGVGLFEIDDNPVPSRYPGAILVSMEDPFTNSVALTSTFANVNQVSKPFIVLTNIQDASDKQICVGERVSFEGDALVAPGYSYGRPEVALSNASVTLLESGLPEHKVYDDLKDVTIQLRRIPGWSGPDYLLTVFGDGTVVFEYRHSKQKIVEVGEEAVRQLLDEFAKVDFLSMPDYDRYGGSDAPYARTTLIRDGNRKSVLHYFGNDLDAKTITNLEQRLDEIVNTDQFLQMCGTAREEFAPYPCPGRK